jgi:cytochrome c peroxidase
MYWKPERLSLVFLWISLMLSCQKEEIKKESYLEIPAGFPMPSFPADNEFTDERFVLGRALFYDPVLSIDSSISCSSCHKPELSFTDARAFSEGVMNRLGDRNAPSLANVAYHPYFLREGGVPTLEMQVGVPIQEHNEFDHNILLIAEKLNANKNYVDMSLKAYNRLPDAFVITRSIACFERALISGNSAYDRFVRGDSSALSASSKNGLRLFNSPDLNCNQCHSSFNFTNYAFENNGLYEIYADPGRMRLTGNESDRALFKVPSLRNVEWTAPYMHDGSKKTLEDVIDHYASHFKNHPHKSNLIKGFTISTSEKKDLINFLKSLTDYKFISNDNFKIK